MSDAPRLAAPHAGRARRDGGYRRAGACRGVTFAVWAAAGLGIALSASAPGQTTRPAGADSIQRGAATTGPAQPASSEVATGRSTIEQQPIRREGSGAARQQPQQQQQASPPGKSTAASGGSGGLGAKRVLLALAAVLVLAVFVLRVFGRWLFPGAASARASTAVRVLARNAITPKQQVLLLQVGSRVIVTADCGAQLTPLAQITDADEVANLLGQLEGERRPAVSKPFGSWFGRAREEFDKMDEAPAAQAPGGESAMDVPKQPDKAPEDLGLISAQGELSGLIERVKVLSQQFRKS